MADAMANLSDIETYVTIAKPRPIVFHFVTTPAWWPIYHPLSEDVQQKPELKVPLTSGVSFVESATVIGRQRHDIHWTCTESREPERMCIQGRTDAFGGIEAWIVYDLEESGPEATKWTRTLSMRFDNDAEVHVAARETMGPEDKICAEVLGNPLVHFCMLRYTVRRDSHASLMNAQRLLENLSALRVCVDSITQDDLLKSLL